MSQQQFVSIAGSAVTLSYQLAGATYGILLGLLAVLSSVWEHHNSGPYIALSPLPPASSRTAEGDQAKAQANDAPPAPADGPHHPATSVVVAPAAAEQPPAPPTPPQPTAPVGFSLLAEDKQGEQLQEQEQEQVEQEELPQQLNGEEGGHADEEEEVYAIGAVPDQVTASLTALGGETDTAGGASAKVVIEDQSGAAAVAEPDLVPGAFHAPAQNGGATAAPPATPNTAPAAPPPPEAGQAAAEPTLTTAHVEPAPTAPGGDASPGPEAGQHGGAGR